MKIKLTSVYVDDQEKALRFYTDVLGFAKKADVSQGPFRWLTVTSPEEPEGTELQLALNDNPAAKAYQRASCVIWIRLPQVSFSIAMVEPVTSVGGIVNSAPRALMRS